MSAKKEYYIIAPNFKGGKCENLLAAEKLCGSSEKLLWLHLVGKKPYTKMTLYACGECTKKDFKLTGLWANSWEKDFIVEKLYKPNEK